MFSSILWRTGRVGSGGRWVWWRQWMVIVVVATVMMIVKCSEDGTPSVAQDCVVYHLDRWEISPVFHFNKNLTVGILPENDNDALEGIHLFMATDETNTTIKFENCVIGGLPGTRRCETRCVKDGHDEHAGSFLPTVSSSSRDPVDWLHIPFSLQNETISTEGIADVCPYAHLPGGNSYFKVIANESSTNIVFNCQEGCLNYIDSTFEKYKNLPLHSKEIYVQKRKDALAKLRVANCGESDNPSDPEDIELPSQINTTNWEKLTFNVAYIIGNESVRYAELKVEDTTVWNAILDDPTNKTTTCLRPQGFENVNWAFGCDPRKSKYEDTTPQSERPEASGNKFSTSDNDTDSDRPDSLTLLLVVLIVVSALVNISCTVKFCISRRRSVMRKRGRFSSVNEGISLAETVNAENRTSMPSHGSSSPRDITVESSSDGDASSRPPAPLPNSSASPPPSSSLTQSPPNSQPGDPAYIYDDPEELMRGTVRPPIRNGSSSNSADPINNRPRMPSPTEERNLTFSGPPEEDENAYCYIDREVLMEQLKKDKEEEERRMRDAASGEGAQLSRHESVNSLYEELKTTDSGQ